MNPIKRIWNFIFRFPTKLSLATAELEEAERALLESQTGKEYAASTCTYNEARITRLRKIINDETKAKKKESSEGDAP